MKERRRKAGCLGRDGRLRHVNIFQHGKGVMRAHGTVLGSSIIVLGWGVGITGMHLLRLFAIHAAHVERHGDLCRSKQA